jgi:hypothetical protein
MPRLENWEIVVCAAVPAIVAAIVTRKELEKMAQELPPRLCGDLHDDELQRKGPDGEVMEGSRITTSVLKSYDLREGKAVTQNTEYQLGVADADFAKHMREHAPEAFATLLAAGRIPLEAMESQAQA